VTTSSELRGNAYLVAALRSLLFIAGEWLLVVLFTLSLPLLFFLPLVHRYAVLTRWSRFALAWLRLTCGLDFSVRGREHIPAGSAVVLSNHQSAWETLAFQSIFPPQVWVLKRSLLWVPFFGWSLAMLRPIAIDRGGHSKALRQVIDQGCDRLATIQPGRGPARRARRGAYTAGGARRRRLLAARRLPDSPGDHSRCRRSTDRYRRMQGQRD